MNISSKSSSQRVAIILWFEFAAMETVEPAIKRIIDSHENVVSLIRLQI